MKAIEETELGHRSKEVGSIRLGRIRECRRSLEGSSSAHTLLELILVVAIIGVFAIGAILVLSSTEDRMRAQLCLTEMGELREALLRFHSDTGFLPREGPFRLVADGGSVPVPLDGAVWFRHPANFQQLFENPLMGTGHALSFWNPETKRGWRGPYLSRRGAAYVDVGAEVFSDGTGSPMRGELLSNVRGIADPYVGTSSGAYGVWRLSREGRALTEWGRPYLLLSTDEPSETRLIGMGRNRVYEEGGGDDVVFELFPEN